MQVGVSILLKYIWHVDWEQSGIELPNLQLVVDLLYFLSFSLFFFLNSGGWVKPRKIHSCNNAENMYLLFHMESCERISKETDKESDYCIDKKISTGFR